MTRNMKRRSTRINREMGRVQYQAVIEKDIGIRDGLDARWDRLHKISDALANRMGMIWMR